MVPVNVELVYGYRIEVLPGRDEVVRRAGGRRAGLQACVGWQQGEIGSGCLEGHHLHAGRARVHLRLVEGIHPRSLERAARGIAEHVDRHVDAIGPDAELRIVTQSAGGVDRVEIPAAADRIPALGHGDALERPGRVDDIAAAIDLEGEIRDHPAILEGVVENHRIAEIVGIAEVAEIALAHERVERERGNLCAIGLAVDADRRVDRLDVVDRADIAVRIGWMSGTPGGKVEPGEIRQWRGSGRHRQRSKRGWRGLGTRQGNAALDLRCLAFRALAAQRWRLRQVAQVKDRAATTGQAKFNCRRGRKRVRRCAFLLDRALGMCAAHERSRQHERRHHDDRFHESP